MEQYKINLEDQDAVKLEKLHFEVEARSNLFIRLVTTVSSTDTTNGFYNKFMNEYTALYKEYMEFKEEIERKYKPAEIANTAKSWFADFNQRVIIFEV